MRSTCKLVSVFRGIVHRTNSERNGGDVDNAFAFTKDSVLLHGGSPSRWFYYLQRSTPS